MGGTGQDVIWREDEMEWTAMRVSVRRIVLEREAQMDGKEYR